LASLEVFPDDARADLHFVSYLQHSLQDGPSSYSSLQVLSVFSRFVHIERSDDDQVGRTGEVSQRDRDPAKVVHYRINVILKLGRDRDDGGVLSDGALDEPSDVFALADGRSRLLDYNVDLVLQDDDVL